MKKPSNYRLRAVWVTVFIAASVLLVGVVGPLARGQGVELRGAIRIGQQNVDGLRVEFYWLASEKDNPQRVRFVLDKTGKYQVRLPQAGPYRVTVSVTPSFPIGSRTVEVSAGSSTADLSFPDTRLDLTIRRADGKPLDVPVQVEFSGPAGGRSTLRAGVVVPARPMVSVVGLPPGMYTFSARTRSLSVARSVPLDLKAGIPASLTLSLGPSRSASLKLVGTFIPDTGTFQATVSSGARPLKRHADGTFDISAVSPGMPVFITAAGHLPTCRLVPDVVSSVIEVRLQALTGTTGVVEVTGEKPAGVLAGLPGTDCPVPVGLFAPANGQPLEFRLNTGNYQYLADDYPPVDIMVTTTSRARIAVPDDCGPCGGPTIVATLLERGSRNPLLRWFRP